jgi:hypothetical protein
MLLAACASPQQQTAPDANATVFSPGAVYAEVKASLIARGLIEYTDLFEIAYPENEQAYTYFLKKGTALLVFVDKDSGKVSAFYRYEKVDQPKGVRNSIKLDVLNIDKELSNSGFEPKPGDGK